MNTLNKKYTVIISVAYVIFAVLYSYAEFHWFSLIYFGAIALIIALADKISPASEPTAPPPSLVVACAAAIGNTTMHEIFYTEHGNLNQLTVSFAIAIFFAGIFALTKPSNLPYAIVGAPLLCFLNLRIALCYCILLAGICAVNIVLIKHSKFTQKKSKKGTQSTPNFNIIAIVVCVISLAICVYRFTQIDFLSPENLYYYMNTFKDNPAIIALAVYLLIKLLKSGFKAKVPMLVTALVLIAAAIVCAIIISWTIFALCCLCVVALFTYCSLQDPKTIASIKADYNSHKFIFWILFLLLLL